jgi:hypothetical protein
MIVGNQKIGATPFELQLENIAQLSVTSIKFNFSNVIDDL